MIAIHTFIKMRIQSIRTAAFLVQLAGILPGFFVEAASAQTYNMSSRGNLLCSLYAAAGLPFVEGRRGVDALQNARINTLAAAWTDIDPEAPEGERLLAYEADVKTRSANMVADGEDEGRSFMIMLTEEDGIGAHQPCMDALAMLIMEQRDGIFVSRKGELLAKGIATPLLDEGPRVGETAPDYGMNEIGNMACAVVAEKRYQASRRDGFQAAYINLLAAGWGSGRPQSLEWQIAWRTYEELAVQATRFGPDAILDLPEAGRNHGPTCLRVIGELSESYDAGTLVSRHDHLRNHMGSGFPELPPRWRQDRPASAAVSAAPTMPGPNTSAAPSGTGIAADAAEDAMPAGAWRDGREEQACVASVDSPEGPIFGALYSEGAFSFMVNLVDPVALGETDGKVSLGLRLDDDTITGIGAVDRGLVIFPMTTALTEHVMKTAAPIVITWSGADGSHGTLAHFTSTGSTKSILRFFECASESYVEGPAPDQFLRWHASR